MKNKYFLLNNFSANNSILSFLNVTKIAYHIIFIILPYILRLSGSKIF